MIVVDTTVLVYAVGDAHPLREPCRHLVEAIGDGAVDAVTTVEVIQELAHVRSRRRSRHDAVAVARDFSLLLAPLLAPTATDLADGLALFEEHEHLGSFDSVLAAVAIRRGAEGLVSADVAFGGISGLRHLTPGSPELQAFLG